MTGALARAETLAFPILFLLSLWVFRGVIAALLPPLVGGIVILGAFLVLRGLTNLHPVSIFALNLATGMGLGLAIDYSLFMVSRFREEMANGATPDVATRTTLRTAGRTVLFSSLTIAAAAASMTVFKINFVWPKGAVLNVVVEAPASAGAQVQAFADSLKSELGVTQVTPAQPVSSDTWKFDVRTDSGNFDPAVQTLVRDIRSKPAPFNFLVSGQAAAFVDLQASLLSRLPVAIAIVTIATIVLLFLMTGSLLLPIKAVVMNLLTLSAAFGVLVLIFQDGRFQDLLQYTSQRALESPQPVLLFAIVFGLSTDYG